AEHGAETAAEMLLIDLALIHYYHAVRVQGWIGNFALLIEHEFFGAKGPTAKLRDLYGNQIAAFTAERYVERVAEQLVPLLDRANRMVIRNLMALRDLRRGPAPAVAIANAGQVNVARQQVNVQGNADGDVG